MEKFFKHPWLIVCIIALITVFFARQLPRAHMDNNISSFLPDDNPARVTAKHLEAEYGDTISILVGLERSYGTVFDSAFLLRIREFVETVETIELVKHTNSLMSAQYITSDGESIIVTGLVGDDFSGTPEEITELKRRISSWDLYQGSLVSDDLSSTQITIKINASSNETENPEVVSVLTKIRAMAKDMFTGYATVYTAGQTVVAATVSESSSADLTLLIPLVLTVLVAVLVLSFRRFSYVILPLLTATVSTIWAIGAMPLLGVTMTMLCIILPIILIAVGSAYAIHLISHYKDEIDNKTFTVEEHRSFVLGFVRKLFKPVFLAALTTFAGFISFSFAPLKSIRDFGVFASFGVFVAFAVAITLIPAILLIRGQRTVRQATRKTAQRKTRVEKIGFNFENKLAGALGAVVKMKTPVLVITAVVVTVSVVGASKIIVDNSLVEFFNDSSEVSRADRFIRERFGGSKSLILSVEADNTNDLLSPETLSAIDGLSTYLIERVPRVTRVTGFTDMIKRMNQLFNMDESPEGLSGVVGIDTSETSTDTFGFGDFGIEDTDEGFSPASSLSASFNGGDTSETIRAEAVSPPSSPETPVSFAMLNTAAGKRANMSANELVRELERMTNYEGYSYYEIPTDPARYGKKTNDELRQLVSNYLVLLSGKTNDSLSNDPLEPTAIMTVILIDSQWQKDSDNVIRAVNNYVEENFPKNVRVLVGGGPPLEGALADLVFYSQMISIITSILIILVIVALSYKSFAAGLIAALPLTIATIGNFAVMGFFGITINIATALIASLAVGIGIDYTIHFIDAFKREYKTGGDYLYRTLAGTGKAILINAVSVGAGFCVLVFSQFRILAQFGGLIALSMGISAVVSLTVIPVLLTTVKPKFIYGNNRQSA